jgi:hypothetical protein
MEVVGWTTRAILKETIITLFGQVFTVKILVLIAMMTASWNVTE